MTVDEAMDARNWSEATIRNNPDEALVVIETLSAAVRELREEIHITDTARSKITLDYYQCADRAEAAEDREAAWHENYDNLHEKLTQAEAQRDQAVKDHIRCCETNNENANRLGHALLEIDTLRRQLATARGLLESAKDTFEFNGLGKRAYIVELIKQYLAAMEEK